MYFSGKISNSFFSFLKRCEFDTSRFFEMTPLEMDFLKDPHSWMHAGELEKLLNNMQKAYQHQFMDKDLVTTVGHNSASLKSWGGLEDFLKMCGSPLEIHEKLEVFFSYFVSPVFKITRKERSMDKFTFKAGFSDRLYPNVKSYFFSCFRSASSVHRGRFDGGAVEGRAGGCLLSDREKSVLSFGRQAFFSPSQYIVKPGGILQKVFKGVSKNRASKPC